MASMAGLTRLRLGCPLARLFAWLLVLGGIAACGGSSFAQEDLQRCEGMVTDDQGAPLAGASIVFFDSARGQESQPVKSSKKGRFAHNTLRANNKPGYDLRVKLEGYRIVRLTVLTAASDGTKFDNENYMVGYAQEGLHKIHVPAQGRSDVTTKGKCVIDIVMASEGSFTEVFKRLEAEKLAKEGRTAEPEAGSEAAGAAPATPAQAAPTTAAASAFERAEQKIGSRDYAGAIPELKEDLQSNPDHAEGYYRLGEALFQTESLAEAETALKRALELKPDMVGPNFYLGMVFARKSRFMQAIPFLEKERALIPDSTTILQNLGKLYADTEQIDKGIEIYSKLIELVPDSIEFYGSLADLHRKAGNTAQEMAVYQQMGEADPSGLAFFNLGNIFFNKDEKEKAAEAYKKAIAQAPDHADAHFQLGLTYVGLARFKEAVSELDTFVKLRPKDPKAAEAKSLAADLRKMGG